MPPKNPLLTIRTSEAKRKKWSQRVDLAREERKRHEQEWDLLIEEYKPTVSERGSPEDVTTNIHFRNVEQKKAMLFFRTPEMRLKPRERTKDPVGAVMGQDGQQQPLTMEQAITIHEHVLNHHMGEGGVNLPHLMDLCLFDCLCPSGFLVSKIGYIPYIKMVEQPVMVDMPDPITGQPTPIPTGEVEEVPVVVKEEYFWNRVSPKRLLIPADFHSTNYERAPWLGVEFEMSLREAKRRYRLPKSFKAGKGTDDQMLLGKNKKASEGKEDLVKGVEIFYKAHLEFDNIVHPDLYHQLIMLEGNEQKGRPFIAVHRRSPYQDIDPETHQLTMDSMIGNPIHVGTLRDLSDSAYVPSDCAMTNTQVKEINTYRQQSVKLRDANLTKFAYDTDAVTPQALHDIRSGDVGQYIAFQGGVLQGGIDKVIAPITKGSGTRVDTQASVQLELDNEKALAIGSNQAGVQTDTARTATELSLIQSNSNVRMEKEQGRVLQYVIAGIRKYDSLLQRFADNDELIDVAGEQGLQGLQTWNKQVIAGRFLYDIFPDSQLRVDAATERNLHMQFYNLTAQDPFNNRVESLKKLQRLFGLDPAKATQQPPEQKPEPNAGFTAKGDDLLGPAGPVVLEMLEQGGFQFSNESKQLIGSLAIRARAAQVMDGLQPQDGSQELRGDTAHEGPAERIQPVDKSQEDHTGSLPGPNVGASGNS